ncbi:hypothetical protein SPRG_01033 [Saprolegnia parasitica CBS 223.65]|uniref:Uncharacterized protein n=1 Tax=Saprolegnia parasitica (strain CBS 223.65) TaxID=695850 RepID=A0A067D8I6_SAPPC|nr:hypothetical protein SPRG_01033 [Saprolegnia parasitica CBS 223.65]KDO34971.1 hypothetical protein SPRG_01033 [Saprolegnia parasitica CBS 223.65]|eukprot:XP_012194625.1 hypothetical protein SPRG_01033 [Saprolegnia parasitica CBS 223.65]
MTGDAELRAATGSIYTLQRAFDSMDALASLDKRAGLHMMNVPLGQDDDDDDDRDVLAHRRSHWNHKCSLSFVQTKTFIPYRTMAETPRSAKQPDVFVLHNVLDYIFVFPFPSFAAPVDVMRFNSTPICHDFRLPMLPTQPTNVVLALLSSDLVVLDPLHGLDTYSHHNRGGRICASPVTSVKWVGQSHTEFVVAHESGDLFLYDHTWSDESLASLVSEESPDFPIRSQREDRVNPTLHWKVSSSAIYDVAFSPHGKYLAIAGRDGSLTVVQFHLQRKIALMKSAFGALTTLAWSPDSNYLLTGGQDDCVTLWSLRHNAAIVRCEGHRSWVTRVAFDEWFCSPQHLRFGSVGEDGMLILWDVPVPGNVDETSGVACRTLSTPTLAATLFDGPATHIAFQAASIAVSARDGAVRVFARPPDDCFPDDVLAQNIPSYDIN